MRTLVRSAYPVSVEAQERAVVKSEGRGYLRPAPVHIGGKAVDASAVELERRSFRRVEYLPATDWHTPPSLFGISLPGVFVPLLNSPFGIDYAAAISEIDAALALKPEPIEAHPQVELIPIHDGAVLPAKTELVDLGRSKFAAQPRQASRGARR